MKSYRNRKGEWTTLTGVVTHVETNVEDGTVLVLKDSNGAVWSFRPTNDAFARMIAKATPRVGHFLAFRYPPDSAQVSQLVP